MTERHKKMLCEAAERAELFAHLVREAVSGDLPAAREVLQRVSRDRGEVWMGPEDAWHALAVLLGREDLKEEEDVDHPSHEARSSSREGVVE